MTKLANFDLIDLIISLHVKYNAITKFPNQHIIILVTLTVVLLLLTPTNT